MAISTNQASSTGGVHPRDIINKYLSWVIGFIAIIVIVTGIKNSWHEAPSLSAIALWGRAYWLWVIGIGIALTALIDFNKSSLKGAGKMLKQVVLGATVAVLILATPLGGWIVGLADDKPTEQMKRGSLPPALAEALPVLVVPPGGNSEFLTANAGYAVHFVGNGFEHHCVYTDGSEGVVGNLNHPCRDGPIRYQYVRNTTSETITVPYEFVRPRH